MIGVFDSGAGGRFALRELRRLRGDIDIAFLADEENAPYGERSEGELIRLVQNDIKRLRSVGADKILIACCTASTVWDKLGAEYRRDTYPIIAPVARRALSVSRGGRIGVISTEATKRSGAFQRLIPDALCHAAPELVTLAESGACDGNLTESQRNIIKKAVEPFSDCDVDTLILGCTHFAYFEREIESILGIPTVNSARVAAREMAKRVENEGSGKTVWLT